MASSTLGFRDLVELRLGDLGLHEGGHLLLERALADIPVGQALSVQGVSPTLAIDLAAWCRAQGHAYDGTRVTRGSATLARWRGAERAGQPDAALPDAVVERPPARWGLAARGALVEAGAPEPAFLLTDKRSVWSEDVARLYAQAAAAQWDPALAVPWEAVEELPTEIEGAVVQIMTYLVENENAALLVPARFLSQLHPHFREAMQLLAIQCADEARHVEVFTRRALLQQGQLGTSSAGGQASLQSLMREPDFALAMFLLSVMGEGTFLSLLWFIREHAPDPVTEAVVRLAAQDEARHVAFGLSHLARHAEQEPSLRWRLAAAVERRHGALAQTAGLNQDVFDALTLLAAGSFEPAAIRRGHRAVSQLQQEMDGARRQRLERLGFSTGEAETLSALHTRNFM